MRRDLDALIGEARRAEDPAARDMASAREELARRITRGDHVELEAEPPEVARGALRAPGLARGGWALLGAAAVAAALLVDRSAPSSDGATVQAPPAAQTRVEREPAQREPVQREPVQPEPSATGAAPNRVLQPLPEPASGAPPPRAARPSPPALPPAAREPVTGNLAAESRALADVQRALRDGEFTRALQLLGEHDRQFARGVLQEERAAARVIASCGAGLGEATRESARAFASRYRNSPLRARVRASCKELERELPEHGP